MASTSDPPAAGGGEASSVAVAAAPASSVEPLPLSSSSSKRRWSPCTWRYAIEEVQPELGSRPRSNSSSPFYSASSLRLGSEPAAPALPTASKARPNHHQDHQYGKEGEEPVRRSAYGNRTWGGAELSELRARHAQPRSHDTLSRKKRPPHPQMHQQKESVKRQSPKDDEVGEEEEEENEDDDDDGDDAELGHHFEEGKKRKKREMSPSELYYCEICKAEASKSNIVADIPPPLQDP